MFRQVIVCQWAEGASPETKQAYRDSLDSLRAIPELIDMKYGDDAGHFDDNFDFVIVADFADFDSARRYVAHPLHQAYVRDHATKTIGSRIVVQHDWDAAEV
jgi:hypothetical protein